MRRRWFQHRTSRRALLRWRALGIVVFLLAIVGAGVANNLAFAQGGVRGAFETIVAEPSAVSSDAAGHVVQAGCAVQILCSVFLPVSDMQPVIWVRKLTLSRARTNFRYGRITTPAPPPPKPLI